MFDRVLPIIENRRVARDVHLLALCSEETAAAAGPGQFVMIRIGDGLDPLLRRPFSICSVGNGDVLRVLYRVAGRGTRILSALAPGARLAVLGPLGRGFAPGSGSKRPVLVGGGVGVAPLVFLAQRLQGAFRFLMGFRSSADLIPPSLLDLPEGAVSIATDDGSAGHRGLVTELLEESWGENPEGPSAIFACGPAPMLRRVAAFASRRRVPCQVSQLAPIACGLGACQGCAVRSTAGGGGAYALVCRDGPVFDAGTVWWEPGIGKA